MKYCFLCIISFLMIQIACCQEYSGVNFRTITFQEALDQAKKEHKLLFIDCYTAWCMPCAHMNGSVFPLKEVGELLNREFVSLRMDMEHGEGKGLKQAYDVNFYPTFLMLDPDAKEIHRFIGAMPAEMFLEKIRRGLKAETSTSAMEQKYRQGDRTVHFLSEYLPLLYTIGKHAQLNEAMEEMRERLTDAEKQSPEYWWLFENNDLSPYDSPEFGYLVENRVAFGRNNGETDVKARIRDEINRVLQNYLSRTVEDTGKEETKELNHIASVLRKNLEDDVDLKAKCAIARAKGRSTDGGFWKVCRKELAKMSDEGIYSTYAILTNGGLEKYTSVQQDYILETGAIQADRMTGKGYKSALLELVQQLSVECKQGVVFFEGNLSQALEKAKAEGKLVFVDCYTGWCVPCKLMVNDVFPLKRIGDFFRKHFIAVKEDMEQEEGLKIKDKYNIQLYPTFLLLTPDGKEQHRIVGSCDPDIFLDKLNAGVEYKTSSSYQHVRYRSGERNRKFLASYVKLLLEHYQEDLARHIVDSLMTQLTDKEKQSSRYWWIFSDEYLSPFGSEYFLYMLDHQQEFRRQHGDAVVKYLASETAKRIEPFILGTAQMVDLEKSRTDLAEMKKFIYVHRLAIPDMVVRLEMADARCRGDLDLFITVFGEHLGDFDLDQKVSLYNIFVVGLFQNPGLTEKQYRMIKEIGMRILPELTTKAHKEWMKGILDDLEERLQNKKG